MIQWASSASTLVGEKESGDACAVVPFAGGTLLVVADGLGHGPEAAEASRLAVRVVREHPESDLAALVQRCHDALADTRGAVISLAAISEDERELSWLGVGDAAATLVRSEPAPRRRTTLLLRPGVVGLRLPRLITETLPLSVGDTVVMCTDGIRSAHIEALEMRATPRELADLILATYARQYDDALVLVARTLVEGG